MRYSARVQKKNNGLSQIAGGNQKNIRPKIVFEEGKGFLISEKAYVGNVGSKVYNTVISIQLK